MTTPIRIMLVDDHSQVHRALSVLNDLYDDLVVVAHASNGQEATALCDEHLPDIILMDVVMPVMNGIEATRAIHQRHPAVKILALSSFGDESSVQDMLKAGAAGYLLKNSSVDEVAHSVRAAYSGKTVLSAEVTQVLLQPRAEEVPAAPAPVEDFGLSAREREVLNLMAKGHNNRQIAETLFISEATAKFHVRSILAKLNVSGRVEAVALAIEKKLV